MTFVRRRKTGHLAAGNETKPKAGFGTTAPLEKKRSQGALHLRLAARDGRARFSLPSEFRKLSTGQVFKPKSIINASDPG
jgi:hypothetical protein